MERDTHIPRRIVVATIKGKVMKELPRGLGYASGLLH